MESVGQKLREARLRMNLGLEDVSAKTRINLRNLQAIEADDVGQICSPFTYRSFVRQFAACVGLSWAAIEPFVAQTSSEMPAPLVPGENGAPLPPSVASLRPKRINRMKWALSFASLCLTVGLCSSFYGAWQNARTDLRGSFKAFVNSFTPHAGTTTVAKAVAPVKAAPVTQQVAATPDGFRIQLSAVENCWLSVVTDGKEVFSGVLEPSQTKVLDGHDEARVRAGNAGGVEVSFNGRSLGPLGRRGEVRTVVFTKNGYEVLDPEAHVTRPGAQVTPSGE